MASNHKKKKITIFGLALAAVVSVGGMVQKCVKKTKDWDKKTIVVDKDTLTLQQFYENLKHKGKDIWWVENQDTAKYVFGLSDDDVIDSCLNKKSSSEVKVVYDTIYVFLKNGRTFYESNGKISDSLPKFGSTTYQKNECHVRHFVPKGDDPNLLKICNCYNHLHSYEHELWHIHNNRAGLYRGGQSHELKFVECVIDEVSANIVQLLKMRGEYLNNKKNYLRDEYPFYYNAICEGKIFPKADQRMSPEEIALIGNGMLEYWMDRKFEKFYRDDLISKTYRILKDDRSAKIQPDNAKHKKLMTEMLTIDGVNFFAYMKNCDESIIKYIPENAPFEQDKLEKKQEYEQLKKLFPEKEIGSKELEEELEKNILLAKIRKTLER